MFAEQDMFLTDTSSLHWPLQSSVLMSVQCSPECYFISTSAACYVLFWQYSLFCIHGVIVTVNTSGKFGCSKLLFPKEKRLPKDGNEFQFETCACVGHSVVISLNSCQACCKGTLS
ncbi:hypothetical protein VPH35_131718 [Triticum aestivum]